MKCTTLDQAQGRYGHIDLASGYWPAQGYWITMLAVQPGMFPNWKVLNTDHPVTHIACNKDMADPLNAVLLELSAKGLGHELKTFDGCFNIRLVRGSNSISTHSYGLAIDINARENPLGSLITTFSLEYLAVWKSHNFDWGGSFKHRKDPMHHSYAWE